MRKTSQYLFLLLTVILTFTNCQRNNKLYIDTDYPNSTPKLFADEIFSKFGMLKCLSVSSDLSEYYFQPTMRNGRANMILRLKGGMDNFFIDTVFNVNTDSQYKACFEPWISYNNEELYFMAMTDMLNRDIYKLIREGDKWSNPIRLDSNINTSWKEAHPSLSRNKTLYFHSWDKSVYENNIYYSRFIDGKFTKRTKIDKLGKNGDAGDPAISPDESFIVFVSSRETSFGESDLYISFNKEGVWTTPRNLGAEINTPEIELGPSISPDGRFLFFYRQDKWSNAKYSKIYWVDILEVIKKNNQTE